VKPSTIEVDGLTTRELKMNKCEEIIRILLVDDHAMIRQGLRSYLSTYYPDLEVVGEASSGEEALQAVQSLSPSVVVMDINLPGLDGIEATARIKHTHPHVGVVGLSMHVEEYFRRAIIAAGATALISKEAVVEDLYDAIIKCSCASG
jgi:NarL family two-component system response regulator LiaR